MLGFELQSVIIARNRLVRSVELEQHIAAIAERIQVFGIKGERVLEARERLGGVTKLQQRHAPSIERIRIVRRDGVGGIVARQSLGKAARRIKDQPEIGMHVGAPVIDIQCGTNERKRGLQSPMLIVEHSKKMQRVEISRITLQDGGVETFRPTQVALVVRAAGPPDHLRQLRLRQRHLAQPRSATDGRRKIASGSRGHGAGPGGARSRFLTIRKQAW